MINELLSCTYKKFIINPINIPSDYQEEFNQDVFKQNLIRQKIIAVVLFILNIVLIVVDIIRYHAFSSDNRGYKNLLLAHIFLFLVMLVYLFIISIRNKKEAFAIRKFDTVSSYAITILTLTWCTAISINAQILHHQISAYIIGIFCVASVLIINPFKLIYIYLLQLILFIIGLLVVKDNLQQLSSNIVNSSILTILALIVSYINYTTYIKVFINKMVILQKNEKISELFKVSEENLNRRTEELTSTYELLISEINQKNEMEIQMMKSSLLVQEKERLLHEASEYEKLRINFFANISHELKTPLTIIFSAEQMLDSLLTKEISDINLGDIRKYLISIKQNCYRLMRLIGNLLDITRVDANHFMLDVKNSDIVKIVEDTALSIAKYVEDKNIKLIFDTEIEEKIIQFDPIKMERVVLNLLSNAVKFTPQHGSIYVNIYESEYKVIISVKDTGIGIPKEMTDLIFERFVQVDKSLKKNQEGSGIGLSLVKSIVELHSGTISVKSEYGKVYN
jgi:two-component system phosphate regulon sensor histidine kinase PhoR